MTKKIISLPPGSPIVPKINWNFVLPLLVLCFVNLPYFIPSYNFIPVHDTMADAFNFFFVYNEYTQNSEMPLWSPYFLYGSPTDHYFLHSISPASHFTIFIGKLFSISNALLLFKLAIFFEQLALLIGTYLLAKRLFAHRLTTIFVSLGTVTVTFWAIQLHFNFRIYYLMPLIFLFIIKFYDTYEVRYLLSVGIVMVISFIGVTTYFAPLLAFTYSVFFIGLFIPKLKQQFQLKRIRSLDAFTLLCILGGISIIYMNHARHVFDYTMLYVQGRDPFTGRVPLWTYLTYYGGMQHGMGLKSFLEIIYAVPSCNEETFYIGLIPLVFLIYALLKSHKNYLFKAFLLTILLILALSLPLLNFIAPILYFLFPMMNYFRHLFLVRQLTKVLIIISAGFGLDHYLSSSDKASNLSLIMRIGGGMLLLIFFLDIFAFKGKLPYQHIPIKEQHYSIYFHYIAFGILSMFLYKIYLALITKKTSIQYTLIICFLVEMISYNHFLFFLAPITVKNLEPRKKYETAENFQQNFSAFKNILNTRRYDLQFIRTKVKQTHQIIDNTAPLLTRYYGAKFGYLYPAAYVDPCFQEYRVDFMPLSIDRFVRARLGIPLDAPLQGDPPLPKALSNDSVFLKALGCNSPKLFLTSNVHIVKEIGKAVQIIKRAQNINSVPVLFDETLQDAPPSSSPSPQPTDNGQLNVLSFTANSLQVSADVNSSTGAWLIYLDSYHPGWNATVNNQPQRIIPANLAFKAVHLSPGMNKIQFTFTGGYKLSKLAIHVFFFIGIIGTIILLWVTFLLSVSRVDRRSFQ